MLRRVQDCDTIIMKLHCVLPESVREKHVDPNGRERGGDRYDRSGADDGSGALLMTFLGTATEDTAGSRCHPEYKTDLHKP